VEESDLNEDVDAGTPEATERIRRRPNRPFLLSAALAIGLMVAGLAMWSRADTSIHIPDLIGRPVDPVGDNLAFTFDTIGLTIDVIDLSDCRVRNTNLVVKQSPAPRTRVSAGTLVTVYVCRAPAAETNP
jgi:beta-lactam-binding protein with PASTA domain